MCPHYGRDAPFDERDAFAKLLQRLDISVTPLSASRKWGGVVAGVVGWLLISGTATGGWTGAALVLDLI